ncbi:TRAP transporter large permease subunit [bacterium]|nr:TRAP transporter large permease subunit [bacterium]
MWLVELSRILKRTLYPFGFGSIIVSGAAVILMMMVIVVDVTSRNVFNISLPGATEVVRVLMILAVFGGMSYTALKSAHIRVDIFINKFSKQVRQSVITAADLLAFGVIVVIAVGTFIEAQTLWNEQGNTGLLRIPFAPFAFATAIFLVFFAVALLIDFLESTGEIIAGGDNVALYLIPSIVIVAGLFFLALDPSVIPIKTSSGIAGIVSLIFMFVLIFLGVHIGAAMAFITLFGLSYLVSPEAGRTLLSMTSQSIASDYIWSVFPLFAFLGIMASSIGFGKDIYETAYKWLGSLPGGLAVATVAGCGGFAAIVGDSTTGVVAMSAISYPEMKARKYSERLSTGCICAGGALGILIPPSLGLLVYGIITEQSIGKLFLAALLPGILEALALMLYIYVICKRNPELGPPGNRSTLTEKLSSLKNAWHIIILFILVLGGIYSGIFTAYEAAAIGSFAVVIMGIFTNRLNFKIFFDSIIEASKMTSLILFIFVYANSLGQLLAISQVPMTLANFVTGLDVNRYGTLFAIYILYLLLGCVMNVIPAMILTLPIIFPTIIHLGFDPIWFGINVTILLEIGVLTPPIGMNVFAMSGIIKDVPINTIFRGVFPFWMMMLSVLAILTLFPQISLFLISL